MSALHKGNRDNLVISPNLWAGVGLVRGGAGTALVGNPQQVAERIREYQAFRDHEFYFLRLPASRRGTSFRRAGHAAAAAEYASA